MNIIEIKIPEIKAYKNNAKTHDEKQIGMIAESIKSFGFRQPLVIDKNNEIVVGHGRYFAAKKLGLLTVPCEYADDLTDDEIKAYRLADNKLNESPWDFDKINDELSSINFDMADFGFDTELKSISKENIDGYIDDFFSDNPKEKETKSEDVHQNVEQNQKDTDADADADDTGFVKIIVSVKKDDVDCLKSFLDEKRFSYNEYV